MIMNKTKKIFLILCITIMIFSCHKNKNTDGPIIDADKIEYDYGTIKQYSEGVCTFTIINKGKKTLVINEVKSSCGCTIPTISNNLVKSNNKIIMNIKYNTDAIGEFHKTIVIRSNAVNASDFILKIKGKVIN